MWNSFLNEEAALGKRHLGATSLLAPAPYQHLALGTTRKEEATGNLCGQGPELTAGLLDPHDDIRPADESTETWGDIITCPGYPAGK